MYSQINYVLLIEWMKYKWAGLPERLQILLLYKVEFFTHLFYSICLELQCFIFTYKCKLSLKSVIWNIIISSSLDIIA